MAEENKKVEQEIKRTIIKKGGDKFELTQEVPGKSTTIQIYKKTELFQAYDNAKSAMPIIQQNIKEIKADIEKFVVEETEETKKFVKIMETIQKLNQKKKLEGDLITQTSQLKTYTRDIIEIEGVMPEIKRRSKK